MLKHDRKLETDIIRGCKNFKYVRILFEKSVDSRREIIRPRKMRNKKASPLGQKGHIVEWVPSIYTFS